MTMSCFKCLKICEKLSVCSRCGVIVYCSKECQRRDWPRHKQDCKENVFKLIQTQSRGISVVATQDLNPGSKVFQVDSFLSKDPIIFFVLAQEEPILLINIPSNAINAQIVLKEDYDEQWSNVSPETFRNNVAKALGILTIL